MQSLLKPALIGGVALGVASGVPFVNLMNCFCCAWVIGGGLLASYLFLKDRPPGPAPWGESLLLGVLTGSIGAVVQTLVDLPFRFLSGRFMSNNSEWIEDMIGQAGLPPELAEQISAGGSGGAGLVAGIGMFFFGLILFSAMATIGTLIGTAILGNQSSSETV